MVFSGAYCPEEKAEGKNFDEIKQIIHKWQDQGKCETISEVKDSWYKNLPGIVIA